MGAMAENTFTGRNEKARFVLENFDSPVIAKVAHRSEGQMTVKQALPFLKLESGLRDEQGRRAVIRSVGVTVEGGTPNLVLDLVYDATIGPTEPSIGLDDTLPAQTLIASTRPGRPDQTIPYGFARGESRHDRGAIRRRQRRAFIPDESNGCYLLTKRKAEPRVVIAPERTRQIHREATLVTSPPEFRNAVRPKTVCGPSQEPTAVAKSRSKPSFSSRARALAAAFWGHLGEGRQRP